MVANMWVYLRDGEWQMLVVAIGIALAWILLTFAYQQARVHHFDRAGYLTLAGVMVGLGIGELVHAGLTLVLGLTGLAAIFLAGALTLPRRWGGWLFAAALYAAYFWAVNRFEPLPRLDVADIASFQIAVIAIVIALLAILFWQFIRLFRFGTIRARLLATFVVLVLLPSLAIGAISNVLRASRATNQVLALLDTVAASNRLRFRAGRTRSFPACSSPCPPLTNSMPPRLFFRVPIISIQPLTSLPWIKSVPALSCSSSADRLSMSFSWSNPAA